MDLTNPAAPMPRTAVICGAGSAGREAARMARRSGMRIAAFTDRDPRLHHTLVDGIPVVSLEEGLGQGLPCILGSQLHGESITRDIQAVLRSSGMAPPPLIPLEALAGAHAYAVPGPQDPPDGLDASRFQLAGNLDLLRATRHLAFTRVLDIGCGEGAASGYFAGQGKTVVAIGLDLASYGLRPAGEGGAGSRVRCIETPFETFQASGTFDLVWMSHVLEHTQNVGLFLAKARGLLDDRGWLCVLVPPYKPEVVGGHVSAGWNLGHLMYNLLLSGYDIRNGHFITHGYNVAAFVQKSARPLPPLRMDIGDIEATKELWPMEVAQGFDGNLDRVNWPWW
jgi:SAM-dependent methyltransferase